MFQSMVDIQPAAAEIRRGKKRKKAGYKEITGQKYNGPLLHKAAIISQSLLTWQVRVCWVYTRRRCICLSTQRHVRCVTLHVQAHAAPPGLSPDHPPSATRLPATVSPKKQVSSLHLTHFYASSQYYRRTSVGRSVCLSRS